MSELRKSRATWEYFSITVCKLCNSMLSCYTYPDIQFQFLQDTVSSFGILCRGSLCRGAASRPQQLGVQGRASRLI